MLERLIGMKYPVQDEGGKVVGYRIIKHISWLENVPALVLYFDDKKERGVQMLITSANWFLRDGGYKGPDVDKSADAMSTEKK